MNIKFFLIILLFLLFLIVEIIIIFLRNKKSNSEVIDEYIQNRKNGHFYSKSGSESLLITKIWDFNKTILDKWADIDLLIAINEAKTNRKMKKGLKNIANNLREIADKLDKAVEEKDVDIINEE